jgi:hypothetical protein
MGTTNMHDKEEVGTNLLLYLFICLFSHGNFGAMQHLHFCLTNLKNCWV